MELYLARHGNTFNPGDKIVRVGATEDLPLVEKGIAQARTLASAFKREGVTPRVTYCSPLQRTQAFAQTILEELACDSQPIVSEYLNEIDYGDWAGLSNHEIEERFGNDSLQAWDERSHWPSHANWGSSEEEITTRVTDFAEQLEPGATLIVSSNGLLRYFLKLVPGAFEDKIASQDFKMKTGYLSKMTCINGQWQLNFWNADPDLPTL